MESPVSPEFRASLRQHLQTDLLLGVQMAPLSIGTARSGPGSVRPAASPSAAARSSGGAPVPPASALQQLPAAEVERRREALRVLDDEQVKVCTRCKLCETRTKTVFGQGSPAARLVFVGEGPGHDEDLQGLAFVGRAGQLLTKMIEAMGLTRDQVFICNIVKCRPPNNRDPAPDEVSSCWPYLDQQLQIIQPEVIVALGKPASQTLLRTKEGIMRLRGQWHDYYVSGMPGVGDPVPLMPTFHPAYLLRSPNEKGKAWSDLKQVMARLGFPVPER